MGKTECNSAKHLIKMKVQCRNILYMNLLKSIQDIFYLFEEF